MRYVVACFTALLLFVAILSNLPESDATSRPLEPISARKMTEWRRTALGWEPVENLYIHVPADPPRVPLHPASLAALQLLISLGALVTFSPGKFLYEQPN